MSTASNPGTTFEVCREGITSQEVVDYYNQWNSYDKELDALEYKGPKFTAEHAAKYLQKNTSKRILDVGAGTGKIAHELSKLGYNNIDALEPAKEFLENSEYRSLYTKCIFKLLGSQAVSDIADDEYDMIVSSGAFVEGHIPCTGLQDMIRMVKPDGLVLIAMREAYLEVKEYKGRLEPYMQELSDRGYWVQKDRLSIQNFCENKQGLIFVFQVKCRGYSHFTSEVLKQ